MAAKLCKTEVFVYFTVWVTSFSFAFYKVYLIGLNFEKSKPSDFSDGWTILKRKKDTSDDEWGLWTDFSIKLAPWIVLHVIISEMIRYFSTEVIPLFYVFVTMSVLLNYFPALTSAFLIIQLSLFFAGMLTSSKLVVWVIGMFFLLFISSCKDIFMEISQMSFEQYHITTVLNAWFLIRCLDFALSEVNGETKYWTRFLNLLAYTFYLPCFFFGPFLPYDYFKMQVYKAPTYVYGKRFLDLCKSLMKYFIYYMLFEFSSHFMYCNAMHYEIKNFISDGIWTLSGIGLCMANYFYLKYIVIYGFSTSIANYENFKTPDHPKCIYRIHLYSKMWRHFDRGFYLFMFRCIYSPVCGRKNASIFRKSFASFLCFTFVYIWHGGSMSVLYWSSFNFFGLICESVFRKLLRDTSVNKCLVSKISIGNLRRLQALAASPLWILAVVSNFMFFGDYTMGMLFIELLWKGSLVFYVSVTIIAYCMCQVSIETENYENESIKQPMQ